MTITKSKTHFKKKTKISKGHREKNKNIKFDEHNKNNKRQKKAKNKSKKKKLNQKQDERSSLTPDKGSICTSDPEITQKVV